MRILIPVLVVALLAGVLWALVRDDRPARGSQSAGVGAGSSADGGSAANTRTSSGEPGTVGEVSDRGSRSLPGSTASAGSPRHGASSDRPRGTTGGGRGVGDRVSGVNSPGSRVAGSGVSPARSITAASGRDPATWADSSLTRGGGNRSRGASGTRAGSGSSRSSGNSSGVDAVSGAAGDTRSDADSSQQDRLSLRVVGSMADGTGVGDLPDVVVRRSVAVTRNYLHPGDAAATVVVAAGASPLSVPAERGTFVYWAYAPGHAWGRLSLDHSEPGERQLALEQGAATLTVRLDNLEPTADTYLRLFRNQPRGRGVELTAAPEQTLSGLLPGNYFLRVEIGRDFHNAYLLAESQPVLVSGGDQEVVITLPDVPDLEGYSGLSGDLEIAGDWQIEPVSLTVLPLDVPQIQGRSNLIIDSAEMEVQGSVLSWHAGAVVPGRYRLTVAPWGLCQLVTVGESDHHVDITVPAPAELRVQVVSAESGTPVSDLAHLQWWVRGNTRLRSCHPGNEAPDGSSPGSFTFLVPAGELELSQLYEDLWRVDRTPLTVAVGVNEVVVEAHAACGIHVRLFDGEIPLPVTDMPSAISVTAAPGTQGNVISTSWGVGGDGRVMRLSGAGSYDLTVPSILGFEPLPVTRVEVAEGEFVELDLELVPTS